MTGRGGGGQLRAQLADGQEPVVGRAAQDPGPGRQEGRWLMGWHPALDDVEASTSETDARAWTAWRRRQRDNREPSTRRLAPGAAGRCWCGDLHGHDWPGKADGMPHPRVAPDGLCGGG